MLPEEDEKTRKRFKGLEIFEVAFATKPLTGKQFLIVRNATDTERAEGVVDEQTIQSIISEAVQSAVGSINTKLDEVVQNQAKSQEDSTAVMQRLDGLEEFISGDAIEEVELEGSDLDQAVGDIVEDLLSENSEEGSSEVIIDSDENVTESQQATA